MIDLKNIQKSFNDHQVLKGVNLHIEKGKLTTIIGRSGGGKSVLLKHMLGLLKPDQGEVIIDGKNLSQLDDDELRELRKKFGMLFQHAALFDSFNVFENISFPLKEHTDFSQTKIRNRVKEVLNLVGLENVEHKLPSELSGGMRKRVGLARAIALTPEIILYDEPTTGLDPLMTESINELIVKTQKELGVTTVVISHDLEASFKISDEVVMLYEGEIILSGKKSDFQASTHPFVQKFLNV
jgi:phospholipid/cholesterol/gamma-HCH transport system ATP-binding protein